MDNQFVAGDEEAIEQIAIIGLSGRFPGAKTLDHFWQNLLNGNECITHFTEDELAKRGIPKDWLSHPDYVKAGTILDDFDKFDAAFFGYSPAEAESIDPQQRIFLETALEALEIAGCNPETYDGPIGVFAGSNPNHYQDILPGHHDCSDVAAEIEKILGNEKDFLCTRVSYKLNLKGPSLTVQTGCSTSLVAVHQACQSLLNYQCSVALAGGVSINLKQCSGYFYQEGTIVCPDGHCRAFDAKAKGTVLGQGVGIVVLKRLSEALADGDTIYAVIKATAINNDGALKAGFTAPSVDGQAEVIAMAQALAGISADTVSYVEAHGTGTSLGDPIEIAALTQAFRTSTSKNGFCAIGSVKTNIGHADAAAGIAGLIKTILMLHRKKIPPSLHFEKPNPNIDFEKSPFYVPTKASEWEVSGFPRRAGVSSFGLGGTNAHIILEEAPATEDSGPSRSWQIVSLSAQTSTALDQLAGNLNHHLKVNPQLALSDVAYSLQTGRKAHNYRRAFVCRNINEASALLASSDPQRILNGFQEPTQRDIAFMFSGQGSQYVNMGLELYENESEFRQQVDRCSEILERHLSLDMRTLIYPSGSALDEKAHQLKQTYLAQPALFTIEYALAKLWMSWGVIPSALIGHSIGEYVAACLANVFSLEDALFLVATRGRLMQSLPAGSMLAVPLSETELQGFLTQELSLAAVNSPSFCVVSGPNDVVDDFEKRLQMEGIDCTRLHTSHGFHSKMMDPILDEFSEQVKKVKLDSPRIPIASTTLGQWTSPDAMTNPEYWAKNLRQTVRFSQALSEVLTAPDRILLEVGPGQTLSVLARQQMSATNSRVVVSSIRHPEEKTSDLAFIFTTLARLWLVGFEPDWSGYYKHERRRSIPLPTYPFERQRYWPDSQQPTQSLPGRNQTLSKKSNIDNWFYLPSWKRSVASMPVGGSISIDEKLRWLIFTDQDGLGSKLALHLQRYGQEVFILAKGDRFTSVGNGSYTLNPKSRDDYDALIEKLRKLDKIPHKIVHLWGATPSESLPMGNGAFNHFQELGFYSLIYLTQALAKQHVTQAIDLEVVTTHLHEVIDEENCLSPEKATVLGPCKVIPQEYPNITCRSIDLGVGEPVEKSVEQLLAELVSNSADVTVAYRGKYRWVQAFDPVKLTEAIDPRIRLTEEGVYLFTGGLGDMGFVLAAYLAKAVRAKLVMIARTGLPARSEWKQWLDTHSEQDKLSTKIRKVMTLEELGAKVLIIPADVANENQMQEALDRTEQTFGQINGVIHAAGVFVETSIQHITRHDCAQQFQAKVDGLFVLEKVLAGKQIDFCMLTSSLSAVLGGLGFTIYSAANLFMDAFAYRQNQKHSTPWISVNWDAWNLKDEGKQDIGAGSDLAELAIGPQEGESAFQRILSLNLGAQVVISTGDLQARIDKWLKIDSVSEPAQTEQAEAASRYSRPNLSSEYVGPGNSTEQSIADIWQELLSIEKVGIHDNFFELGGHSLLATKVVARLRGVFPIEFSVASLFENPTVHSMSKMILAEQEGVAAYEESKRRGQKRKERRLQRVRPAKRRLSREGLTSI